MISLVVYFTSRNSSEFEDYLQVGSIGLLKAIRAYNQKQPFIPFAKRCIKNELLTYIKTEKKERHKRLYDIPSQLPQESVWDYLPPLSPIDQEIVKLRCMGYTFTEISRIMDIFSRYWISEKYRRIIKHAKKFL